MDTQMSRVRHPEEPYPLPLEVLNRDLIKEEDTTVTFWKKNDFTEDQTSETESEGTHFHRSKDSVISFQPHGQFDYSDDGVSSLKRSSDTFSDRVVYSNSEDFGEVEEIKRRSPSLSQYFHVAPQHGLQSLSHFFTEEEVQMMPPPDAVLGVKDKYFVVLPNAGNSGHTLFHCIGQVITGKERDHSQLRENIVDYICSQEGWDVLGHHVVSFYENLIDEFQSVNVGIEQYGQGESDKFFQRVYRHYFMDEEIEGSLIELVAASFLYGFRYTCLLLEEHDTEKSTCRIFHSFEDDEDTVNTIKSVAKHKKSKGQQISQTNYFLRIGDSPKNWRWILAVPYLRNNCYDRKDNKSCQCVSIPRGSYEVFLWNVHGLTWNKGTSPVKRSKRCHFSWKNGTSVISTSTGKLLGGYETHGKDLFSNLCCLLPNCLHVNNHCLLNDTVAYCPSKLSCADFDDPASFADAIMKNKEYLAKKKSRLKKKDQRRPVGTLHDLHKASKIFNFGYYVVGINEQSEFQILGRLDKDKILYLIARTNYDNVITEWCALGDMRHFKPHLKTDHKEKSYPLPKAWSTPSVINHSLNNDSSNDVGLPLPEKESKETGMRYKFHPLWLNISRYFTCLRLIIRRIRRRNKVQQAKSFPLNSIINENTKIMTSSVK